MKTLIATLMFMLAITGNAAAVIKMDVPASASQFQVRLAANPTTGYRWMIKNYDKALLKKVSAKYIGSQTGLIGAGGTMVFTFSVIKHTRIPDKSVLEFYYARPWEAKTGSSQKVIVNFK